MLTSSSSWRGLVTTKSLSYVIWSTFTSSRKTDIYRHRIADGPLNFAKSLDMSLGKAMRLA